MSVVPPNRNPFRSHDPRREADEPFRPIDPVVALHRILGPVVPQTYGEAVQRYPWLELLPLPPHEWHNRTTLENAAWMIEEGERHIRQLRSQLAEAAGEINIAGPVAHRIRLLKQHYARMMRGQVMNTQPCRHCIEGYPATPFNDGHGPAEISHLVPRTDGPAGTYTRERCTAAVPLVDEPAKKVPCADCEIYGCPDDEPDVKLDRRRRHCACHGRFERNP